MGIDNTTKRMQDPAEKMALLAEGMVTGSPASFIERQESDGQRQLVNSDRLPARFNSGEQAEFEALGFTFGDPDPDDPMFRPATLPTGWKRKGSDHAMWSYIVDEHDRERVSIFYKAAFYDRDAFMNLVGLGWYVTKHVEYGEPLVFDDKWATVEAVAAEMAEARDSYRKEAADFRRYATDETGRRDEKNRAGCTRIADEKEATAAKYDAAIAALTS